MIPKWRIAAVCAAFSVALAGCGGGDDKLPKIDPVACFPKDAQRWVVRSRSESNSSARSNADEVNLRQATVYVDRSGSMVGYLNGANNVERPLHDLVATLPGALKLAGIETSFRSFGKTVSEELPANGDDLLTQGTFTCTGQSRADCDNTESRLDVVLSEIKSKDDDLALVVTDLWFNNSQIQSTGIAALQPVLTDLLFDDKVIAIYGIDAPFTGKIYDLPSGVSGTTTVPYTGRHPLYVVAVGSKQAVIDFDESLSGSGSKFLAEGRESGRIVRTLFAVDPGPVSAQDEAPLSEGKSPRIRRENFGIPQGISMQRFVMTKGLPRKPGAKKDAVPEWTGPDPAAFLPDSVWQGPIQSRTRVWKQVSDSCSPRSWVEQDVSTVGWEDAADPGQRKFGLDPEAFGAMFQTEGVYLVAGETRRQSVTRPNPATEWMRGSWNLDPADSGRVASGSPDVFPTLNLSEFGRIMEVALAKAAERKDQPINGFAVLIKVED